MNPSHGVIGYIFEKAMKIGEINNEVYRDKYPTIRSDWSNLLKTAAEGDVIT